MSGEITVYRVRDADGRLVAEHVREDTADGGKQVRWRLPDGTWGLNGTKLAELPLYGADLISDAGADDLIVLTEGEKARDALQAAGLPAVGTVTGAGGTPGPEALEVLRERRVCLWADNDEVGREHMRRVAEALKDVAAETLVYTWDEAPDKGDAADHPVVKGRDQKAVDRLLTDLEGSPRCKDGRNGERVLPVEVGQLLSEVVAEQVSWMWEKRIPLGKLTVLEGDPGLGKSALITDAAARVTVGRDWPDGSPCEAGGVVICSAEDGLADTIRPRFDAAGGDPERVVAISTVRDGEGNERPLSVPEDLDIIQRGIERVSAKLVIMDPLMAFLSGRVNSHRDQDIRRALTPFAALAEDTGAAVVVVRHLNKATGGSPLYRGGGSIGIVGAARSALLVASDPQDKDRRVMASQKSNLAPLAPSLAFALTEADNEAVRVEWKGETTHSAAALLATPADHEERDALTEARDFLTEVLTPGPVPAKDVLEEAGAASISKRTLDRARKDLGVEATRQGESGKRGGGLWLWVLPES